MAEISVPFNMYVDVNEVMTMYSQFCSFFAYVHKLCSLTFYSLKCIYLLEFLIIYLILGRYCVFSVK